MKKKCFLHSCAVMTAFILLMNAPCTVLASQPEPQDQSVLPDISDPVISPDETSPSGFSVTWDCVYFGSYPTCEVTDSAFSAVEPYAVRDGDVITDPVLYEKLESADWTDNETELDGIKYRRMQAEDAQNWAEDRPQHYRWEDADAWHYFIYSPIKWRVIERNGTEAMLISDRQLDCAPYHAQAEDAFWEDCTLRSFLNGYDGSENTAGISYSQKPQDSFAGTAFSEEELEAVLCETVENPVNYYFGTECGADTKDRVYIPDEEEIFHTEQAQRHGFSPEDGVADYARRFRPTLYAMARGTWYSPVEQNRGNGFWFLRTNGYTPSNANYICDYGAVYNRGTFVTCDDAGIIPVIRVDLTSPAIEAAGTVLSSEAVLTDTKEIPADLESALFEPVKEPDEGLSSGQKTTWSCVYFGSYPSCEVTDKPMTAVEDYALQEGDVLVDAALYESLKNAEWADDELILDDVKYRRIRASDFASMPGDSAGHYRWPDPEEWHYFMYEPVRWRVLELNGNEALLLADEELDCAPYNTQAADVTWEECTLRSFLNGYDGSFNTAGVSYAEKPQDSFYGTAFSEKEKESILKGQVENADNANYGTDCGESTEDKVFILSAEDVYASDAAGRHGFYQGSGVDDPARRFSPTLYAMARGTWYSPVEAYRGNGFWFMRTNGYTTSNVSYICDFGYIYARGTYVTCNDSGLLPAIRVDLSTAGLKEAGTVTDGK